MAYAYSQIDELMGNNQNTNIFGGDQQNQPGQNQNVVNSGQSVKTNTEGDLNASTPNSGSSAPKVTTSSSEQSRQTNQKAFKQNVGKTQKPAALQTVKQGLDTAQAGLQKKAQDYAAAQQAKQNYSVDEGTLGNAIEGDSAASAKTSDLLSRSTYNPVESFDYGDLSVKDANLLDTNAGIKELVGRGKGPRYNQQMGAFDTMLLQMDPNFRNEVQGLKKQSNELQSTADTTKTNAEKAANEAAKANLEAAQNQARTYLGSQASSIEEQNRAEAAARNEALSKVDLNRVGTEAQAKARAEAMAKLDQIFGAGRAANQLQGVNVDPSQFVTRAADATENDFWSGDDARRYNQINTLLGKGGQSAAASLALAPDYTVNQSGILDALLNPAITARQEADTKARASVEEILKQAQTFADADDAKRAEALSSKNLQRSIRDPINRYIGSDDFKRANQNIDPEKLLRGIDQFSQDYASQNPLSSGMDLGATDTLNQGQVEQLNALMQDLYGQNNYTPYSLGQYEQGYAMPSYDAQNINDQFANFWSQFNAPPAAAAPYVNQDPTKGSPAPTGGFTGPDHKVNNKDSPIQMIEEGLGDAGAYIKRGMSRFF